VSGDQDRARKFRLGRHEGIGRGIIRIALEQLDEAVGRLENPGKDADEAIHHARIHIKRLRAIIRLVRGEIGDEVFLQENMRYRYAARRLSAVRDAAAMVEALDKLAMRFADEPARTVLEPARTSLVEAEHSERAAKEEAMSEVTLVLRSARDEIYNWTIESDDFAAVERGLKRTYQHGRRAYKRAARRPGIRNFHQWRKHVKYLWYQMEMLRAFWPRRLNVLATQLEELADYLNDVHDLSMLRGALGRNRGLRNGANTLSDSAEHARRRLVGTALAAGDRVYAQRPGAFARRLKKGWKGGGNLERQ
jgi:CHAD domain-containing protein